MEICLDITFCTKLQYHFAYEGKCIHSPFSSDYLYFLEKDSRRALVNFSHKEVVKRRKFSHSVVNAEKKFNLWFECKSKIVWSKNRATKELLKRTLIKKGRNWSFWPRKSFWHKQVLVPYLLAKFLEIQSFQSQTLRPLELAILFFKVAG